MGDKVLVVGAGTPLGRRVVDRLAADPSVARVVAVVGPGQAEPAGPEDRVAVTWHTVAHPDDLVGVLAAAADGATQVVMLGAPVAGDDVASDLDGTGLLADPVAVRAALDAAAAAGATSVVMLSSALVYGAWPNNPVPLTEDAPLRPDPAVPYVAAVAESERLLGEWSAAHATVSTAVVRPTLTVSGDDREWLARSPWVPTVWTAGDERPPMQFLLLDDLAAAVALVCSTRATGAFNVAPEGWVDHEVVRELCGPRPRIRLPVRTADAVTVSWLRRSGWPESVVAYLHYPWVVASDRLRAAGWEAVDTNEQAFVTAFDAGPFASMDARRRQAVSIGAVVVGAAAVVGTVVALVRRRARRATR